MPEAFLNAVESRGQGEAGLGQRRSGGSKAQVYAADASGAV